jgi:hypothetical protein
MQPSDSALYTPEPDADAPKSGDIAPERLAANREAYEESSNHRFRKKYRPLSPEEEKLADAIKDKANELAGLIDSIIDGTNRGAMSRAVAREKALAQTHLEEVVMRAIRAVTA